MKVYHPQISVKLVKAFQRSELVPGLPVVKKRYGSLEAIDLTPYLGDMGSVSVTKSVRQPTGGFSLTFADKMHPELKETVYALVEPMDLIEIRMVHQAGAMPILMRGFVTEIGRDENMGNGPVRSISVSGHDFAKVLQIILIHFHAFSGASEHILNEFKFFYEYAGSDSIKIKKAADFVTDILNGVVNPYMANITALANGQSVGAKVINKWTPKVSIDGSVSPFVLTQFVNNSLHDVLRTCLDVGVFNEMFVEDTEDGVNLVVRPAPFKSVDGEFIQGSAEELSIPAVDILGNGVRRSDEGVANYFWVSNEAWSLILNEDLQSMAYIGDPDSFILGDYLNASQKYFGFRKMEAVSMIGDDAYSHADAISGKDKPKQTQLMAGWLERRRRLLLEMNKDNLLFETGSLRLRGNEAIKPGMYLNVFRGAGGRVGSCYAHTVSHQFAPFNGFTTTVQIDRGTFFIERARFPASPYIPEIESGVK